MEGERKARSASDSEPPATKKKKNKINTEKGVFKRSQSDIQGRQTRTVKKEANEEKKDDNASTSSSGSFILPRVRQKKEGLGASKEDKKEEKKEDKKKKKDDKKEEKKDDKKEKKEKKEKKGDKKSTGNGNGAASPAKETRKDKIKEKIKESFFLRHRSTKKKEKSVDTDEHETQKKAKKKEKEKVKRKRPAPRRTKEKAKSDSEGTKKWSTAESFRIRMETEFEELEEEERKKRNRRNQELHPALEYHNISKNRYNNVLPNPETRVKLQNKDGSGDYINANYVQGERETYIACQAPLPNTFDDFWRMVWEQRVYVVMMLTRLKERDRVKAEQYWPSVGPLGRTRVFTPLKREKDDGSPDGDDELLRMLHRATNGHDSEEQEEEEEKEKEKEKDKGPKKKLNKPLIREAVYGPGATGDEEQSEDSSDDSLEELAKVRGRTLSIETDWRGLEDEDDEGGFTEYGVIAVRLQRTTQHSKNFIIRHFLIRHAQEKVTRKVVQIHYTGWPDFGTPKSTKTFHRLLTLMESIKKQAPTESQGPIVLHCSAGLGRTGTLIAAHIALEKLRSGGVRKSKVDMKQIVAELREQRNGMVQTKEQYLFLNELVREYSEMSLYV